MPSLIFLSLFSIGLLQFANAEKYRVLVTHPDVPAEAIELLVRTTDVVLCESLQPNRSEILRKVRGVHAIYWASHGTLDKEIIDAAGPQLKVVTTMSAGYSNVDVDYLKNRKIPLGHTPKVLSAAVADVAIGLMVSAARRFREGLEKIQSDQWEITRWNWMFGQDISGATIGFFGFGNIGQAIAKRLMGFDIAEILYTTRKRIDAEKEKKFNAKKVDFSTMLSKSDFVFVVAPLTSETEGVFNATAFSKMKKTAVFVNIARGKIVNQADLFTALKTNEIFAAGLDVTDPEPLAPNDPLVGLPNCVITPHIGSATLRTRVDIAILAANNVLHGLDGKALPAPVY